MAYQTYNDPAVLAFEHDPKKLVGALPKESTLGAFIDAAVDSAINQTKDIGGAYNLGHFAMALADLRQAEGLAPRAMALMVGQYEEQLAGLNKTYRQLYAVLKREAGKVDHLRDGEYVDEGLWEAEVLKLCVALGHTELDGHLVIRISRLRESAKRYLDPNGKGPVYVVGQELLEAITCLLYRRISVGAMNRSGKLFGELVEVGKGAELEVNGTKRTILDHLRGMAGADPYGIPQQLVEFFDDVYPYLPKPRQED